jgi:hypothetical protein
MEKNGFGIDAAAFLSDPLFTTLWEIQLQKSGSLEGKFKGAEKQLRCLLVAYAQYDALSTAHHRAYVADSEMSKFVTKALRQEAIQGLVDAKLIFLSESNPEVWVLTKEGRELAKNFIT